MGWMCPEGHEMVKPNLSWANRPLQEGEQPRTEAERRTHLRWIPICSACGVVVRGQSKPKKELHACSHLTKKKKPCSIPADRTDAEGRPVCHLHDPEGLYVQQCRGHKTALGEVPDSSAEFEYQEGICPVCDRLVTGEGVRREGRLLHDDCSGGRKYSSADLDGILLR